MRAPIILPFLAALAAFWVPQEGIAAQSSDDASSLVPLATPVESSAARSAALASAFDAAEEAWRAAVRQREAVLVQIHSSARNQTRSSGESPPGPVEPGFRGIFLSLAKRGSASAGLWSLKHFRAARAIGNRRLEIEEIGDRVRLYRQLVHDHADDVEALDPALFDLLTEDPDLDLETVRSICRRLLRTSRVEELRAAALLAEGVRTARVGATDSEVQARAAALLDEVLDTFPETRAAESARGLRWQLEHLAIGLVAPNFTTYDAAGNEIRLSDFRGQVVVVRFWGMSHAGGVIHLDRAARFERRNWDERFTWIGVSDDPDREAFVLATEEREFTWTQAWEGGEVHPARDAWRIERFPATYVLDELGVVRGVGLEGLALERLVETLVDDLRRQTDNRERLTSVTEGDGEDL